MLHGMWDLPGPGIELVSLVPCIGRWILNHCATREVLKLRDLRVGRKEIRMVKRRKWFEMEGNELV